MLYSNLFSFFLLFFANVGCSESAASEFIYQPSTCGEVSVIPKQAKTYPAQEVSQKPKRASPEKKPEKKPEKSLEERIKKSPSLSKTINIKTVSPKILVSSDGKLSSDGKVDINLASSRELESLPGIGPALADRIIKYRTKRKFKRLRDIRRVKGIGRAKYKRLEGKIRLN